MVAPTQQNAITPAVAQEDILSVYIRRPEIMEKFALVMPDAQARRYVQNVIVLVETAEPGDWSLQNCSPRSIVRAALRAATQRVSVDPAEREAYLVPRKIKRIVAGVEKKVLEACFQFHYQEIENRAWRTNLYTHITVSPIYDGTEILVDLFTGLHALKLENGREINIQSAKVLAAWGKSDNKKRIGWLGYYKTRFGREKTIYMTVEEIEARVSGANPNWKSSFMWTKHAEIGERKTVLLALLRLADLKSPEMAAVKEALETIDAAESEDMDAYPENEKTIDEKILEAKYVMDENAQAPAALIAPEPEQPKRTESQGLKDLGFDEPATDGTKYKASGTKIVGIVAEIIGCEASEAAQIILAKYAVSEMITESEARAFAQGKIPTP